MADPVFQVAGTLTATGATSTSAVTSVIANVAAGDLVVFGVQRDSIAQITTVAGNGAGLTSFVLLKARAISSGGFGYRLYGAIATSSASSVTLTATFSAAAQWGEGSSARYNNGGSIASLTPLVSGVDYGNSASTGVHTTSTSREMDAVTVTAGKRAILLAAGTEYDLTGTALTAANSWTKRFSTTTEQWLFDRVVGEGTYAGTGTTNRIATTGVSDTYIGVIVALEIAGGDVTANPVGLALSALWKAVSVRLPLPYPTGLDSFVRGDSIKVPMHNKVPFQALSSLKIPSVALGASVALGGRAATSTVNAAGIVVGTFAILLEWDDITPGSEDGYRVQWGPVSGGPYPNSVDLPANTLSYLITYGLVRGITYYWRVCGLVAGVEQTWATESTFGPVT